MKMIFKLEWKKESEEEYSFGPVRIKKDSYLGAKGKTHVKWGVSICGHGDNSAGWRTLALAKKAAENLILEIFHHVAENLKPEKK